MGWQRSPLPSRLARVVGRRRVARRVSWTGAYPRDAVCNIAIAVKLPKIRRGCRASLTQDRGAAGPPQSDRFPPRGLHATTIRFADRSYVAIARAATPPGSRLAIRARGRTHPCCALDDLDSAAAALHDRQPGSGAGAPSDEATRCLGCCAALLSSEGRSAIGRESTLASVSTCPNACGLTTGDCEGVRPTRRRSVGEFGSSRATAVVGRSRSLDLKSPASRPRREPARIRCKRS